MLLIILSHLKKSLLVLHKHHQNFKKLNLSTKWFPLRVLHSTTLQNNMSPSNTTHAHHVGSSDAVPSSVVSYFQIEVLQVHHFNKEKHQDFNLWKLEWNLMYC